MEHHLSISIGRALVLCFALTIGRCNQVNVREVATWNYWQALRENVQKAKHIAKQMNSAKTPEQIATVFRQASTTLEKMGRDISSLDMLNVDTEVTSFGADATEWLYQISALCRDFGVFAEDSKSFVDQSNSLGAGLEAFMRGLLGDPLGAYNDSRAQAKQLEQRRQVLFERFQKIEERNHRLNSEEVRIRATLAQRYKREFPKIEN